MEVPESKQSALLGRFQHLQRLKLIEGINPGRGKAAEYSAYHIVIIAIAFEMLQLGTTPDRAVEIIKKNIKLIQVAIGYAVASKDCVSPSLIRYDPAILTTSDEWDLAHATFHANDEEIGIRQFEWLFISGSVERAVYISLSGTLRHIFAVWDGWPDELETGADDTKIKLGPKSKAFMSALTEWYDNQPPVVSYDNPKA